ncbi:hypothetical protein ElyMa_000637200 [Elysia marginata]|uniref:Uncharacterized protein n=1 Tax=Elysia marginata TaxID=1093978 RepID=A0AAV4GEP6_9GAST|nr:hypothetical protein ElyMa_000637200 [Elysia marginata]
MGSSLGRHRTDRKPLSTRPTHNEHKQTPSLSGRSVFKLFNLRQFTTSRSGTPHTTGMHAHVWYSLQDKHLGVTSPARLSPYTACRLQAPAYLTVCGESSPARPITGTKLTIGNCLDFLQTGIRM